MDTWDIHASDKVSADLVDGYFINFGDKFKILK